jgi:hypothetical protein
MFNGGMKKRKKTNVQADDGDDFGAALRSTELSSIIKRRRMDQLENLEAVTEGDESIDPEFRVSFRVSQRCLTDQFLEFPVSATEDQEVGCFSGRQIREVG